MRMLFSAAAVAVALLFSQGVAEAAHTHVYKTRFRACSGCIYVGYDRQNYENWMYVWDCGGIFDNNCNHEVWEQNYYGSRYYTAYGSGRGLWVGRYHALRYSGRPFCRSYSTSSQGIDNYCYQGYGF